MSEADELRAQLRALQIELIEAAASFDRRRRADAADLALATAHRVGELCAPVEPQFVEDDAPCLSGRDAAQVE